MNITPYTPFITGAVGLLTGLFFERFRNRTLVLSYTITYQSLATTIRNDYWGEIAVSHNGRPINHLNFTTLIIKNTSNIDAQDPIVLETWFNDASQFLGYRGFYDTGNFIATEQGYTGKFNEIIAELERERSIVEEDPTYVRQPTLQSSLNYLLKSKKLTLPVFNRNTSITVDFLVENLEGSTPMMHLSILHKGIKLIPEADKEKREAAKKIIVGAVTLITYILGMIWAYAHYDGKSDAITSTLIIGTVTYFIGYGSYYLYIYLRKFFWK